MEDIIGLVIGVGFTLFMLALGFFVGGATERSHFKRLDEREEATADVFVTQLKSFPGLANSGPPPQAFFGEAVISSDYLKTFTGGLRNLFGGEMRSYVTLLERARREATLRIVEQAQQQGFNAVCNIRYVSTDIGGAAMNPKGAIMATVLASGTAYRRA